MTTPSPGPRCADAPASTPAERLLESRIAELEAEIDELRLAAARAREVAAAATATRAGDLRAIRGLEAEVHDLHARLHRREKVRSLTRVIRRLRP
ncbi:MAG: hypothetical protein ACRDYW_13425 [Acidimicrobiales bacterium]